MKTEGRKRFLLCFQPVTMDDDSLITDRQPCSGDQVFSYISVADKGDLMIPTILQTRSEKEREKEEERSKVYSRNSSSRCTGKITRRIFSAMANVVFFDSKLKRKLRNRKVRHNPNRSGKKISDFDDSNINSLVLSSASSSDSSFSSSTSVSRSSSTSLAPGGTLTGFNWEKEVKQNDGSVGSIQRNFQHPRQKARKRTGTGFYRYCHGLLLILICFSMVIFWGRLFAILCTSTWLYLAPRRNHDSRQTVDTDSAEYKKKVIMEGLLERSKSHLVYG
ncbi:hypothetical protein NE237_000574 [Protea cynaroides]|uniref:Uncharacterized protein n=1 Tax=Protea cynaroides TaxID=273540 RepID=A0A9Q0KRF6_9MAGN|nr:hypothetical protein NE237_000574 [Protea cynaroides]